jgi:hypothetical protein
MRDKLNENPLMQVAVIGVLLVAAAVFVMSSMGGGGESEESSTTTTTGSATVSTPSGSATVTATVTTPTSEEAAAPTSAAPVPTPPLPHRLIAAFAANRTVVLLIVKRGGIDDAMTAAGTLPLAFTRNVSLFVIPANRIARYTAITQGVDVSRVPALVVVRPRNLDDGVATASVSYGFQGPESIEQAVVDARYKGRTLSYHP